MVRIGIDIDGTLGYRNRQQYLTTCNETLKLALPHERLQGISLQDFYHFPEVLAYRQRVGEAHYTKAIGWIDYHPEVLRAMHPLPGVQKGVCLLAALGNIAYYTARYTTQSEEHNQDMRQATFDWLTSSAFLNPTGVVFCDGLSGKLQQLAQEIAHDAQPVLLVDDQHTRLLQRLTRLDAEPAQRIKRSLILIAYGARTVPESAPIPVVALPSWEEGAVHSMLESVTRLLAREEEAKTTNDID